MEFQRILVGIDRSTQADAVFQKALLLAKRERAYLKVFHCIPVPPVPIASRMDLYGEGLNGAAQKQQERLQQEVAEVEAWLQTYLQQALALGVQAQLEYQLGDAGFWIREIAVSWDADLVVIGRRGRSKLAELVLGSVSNYVVHHTHCSVMIVRGTEVAG
ncbi:universal stress protein [Microcoleus sp. FACHB-672]|uniref:universal stress protein n=1 Tax=Microcoleus sp. FACHB-672 TaxID=2692825 RepID=UPI0016893716|nr:universal stress protein [Microcoleus sp. FACHB-672]MBD2042469.1 universal stress protein [Microcoleus sp. FACHB-672]